MSTRKTGPDADALAAIIAGFDRLLHEILASVKMPLDELSAAHFVAINIPPVALKGFERDLLHLIVKIRAIGPHVAIIVQPSLRNKLTCFVGPQVEQDGRTTIPTHSYLLLQVGEPKDVTSRCYVELRIWKQQS